MPRGRSGSAEHRQALGVPSPWGIVMSAQKSAGSGGSMKDYGLTVHPHGVVWHSDRRMRVWSKDGVLEAFRPKVVGRRRQRVQSFSKTSQRRLAMVAANVGGQFRSHLTLTYHGLTVAGEDEAARNLRIAVRAKRDLNRFLTSMRRMLGLYLWVMEFQRRGVVHFHALCEHLVEQERVAMAWCRSTGELGDIHAAQHAARVDAIRDERAARCYVGRYLGKVDQKSLPAGIVSAGRWWGRSRRLKLVVLEQVLTCEADSVVPIEAGVRTVRAARRWLRRELGWKFRGGAFVSWGDRLTGRLRAVVAQLRGYFGEARRWSDVIGEQGGAR